MKQEGTSRGPGETEGSGSEARRPPGSGGAQSKGGSPGTHQNHLGAPGAEDFMGPGLSRLRGTVPLSVQLQADRVMPHGVQQLGHLTRLQVVKVDGGTHNLVP